MWMIALYIALTGDPTRMLISSRFAAAPRQDAGDAALWYFAAGLVMFVIVWWKRYVRR